MRPHPYKYVASGASSVLDFVHRNVEKRGDATAALTKREGKYRPVTWNQMWASAREIAFGLIAHGLETGDRVCIISNTRLEWVTTDLGILAAGGVTVPIYPSNLPEECRYVADHSDARVVFCEDATQAAKFLEVRDQLPKVERVVQLTGEVEGADGWVMGLADFIAAGREDEAELERRGKSLDGDSILTIIYTSGTTGLPKGVVLTHSNLIYEGDVVESAGIVQPDDVQLLFLPLAHSFAKFLEVAWFATGSVTAFAENMNTIKQNLGEVRPTLMSGVPRVYEKFYAAVLDKGLAAEPPRRKVFEKALELSQRNGEAQEAGGRLGIRDTILFAILKRLVFAKVHEGVQEILGGRMRIMVSGGAPLSRKIAWFFRDANITIIEGYGLTETSAATCVNLPERNQIGTVGPPLDRTEAKIAPDGEVLLRGPGIMREYWKDPDATAETIVDGWLHTGDIGEVDPVTGAVRITDRKKDLIVTAGGKNVAPQKIEGLLKTEKLISQAVVHGDKRKFLSALITVDEAILSELAASKGWSGQYAELVKRQEVRTEVERIVESTNTELASYETVKKFHILEQDFSVESGELTAKLSVKRKVVNRKFGHLFDAFYEEKF